MTTEEKLNNIYDITINSALRKKEAMMNEYQAVLDVQFENYMKDMNAHYEAQEKNELEILRLEFSKEFSASLQHIKRKLTHKKDDLKEQLFAEVTSMLNDFLQTEEQTKLLVKEIKFALTIAPTEPITIYIDPVDADKKDYLEEVTGADISISAYSFGQGMRALIPSKNILVDYSFNTKISEIKDDYTIPLQ